MYMTLPYKGINWHRKYSSLQEIFWVTLAESLRPRPTAPAARPGQSEGARELLRPALRPRRCRTWPSSVSISCAAATTVFEIAERTSNCAGAATRWGSKQSGFRPIC